jgi:hypothetical protein
LKQKQSIISCYDASYSELKLKLWTTEMPRRPRRRPVEVIRAKLPPRSPNPRRLIAGSHWRSGLSLSGQDRAFDIELDADTCAEPEPSPRIRH